MHILRLAPLLVCVLLACDRSAETARPSVDSKAAHTSQPGEPPALGADSGVLFAVFEASGGENNLMPIAIVVRDSLIQPPRPTEDHPDDPFRVRYLQSRMSYALIVDGSTIGNVRVKSAAYGGCEDYTVSALPERPNPPFDVALAGRLPLTARAVSRRRASPTESHVLESLVRALVEAQDIPWESLRAEMAPASFAFDIGTGGPTALVGNFEYVVPPSDSNKTVSVSLIAESTDRGWSVRWSSVNPGQGPENNTGGPRPMDVFDLGGDGSVELLFRHYGWESISFLVMRRGSAGWSTIYAGGGAGC